VISRFHTCWLCFIIIFFHVFCDKANAATIDWQNIDKQLQNKIFQLNIGIDIRLKDGSCVQLTGLSPKQHYYVFTTTPQDQGYQIVGHGSSFPVATTSRQKIFFVTSEHVLAEATETVEECEMFYAAMQLYASDTTIDNNTDKRMKELLNIVNLSLKENLNAEEKTRYEQTVDTIWDYYDNNLSPQADPWRRAYNQYKKVAGLQVLTAYLLHAPGPMTQPPVEATIYKRAPNHNVDLAILTTGSIVEVKALDLDPISPRPGQEIQAAGYPIISQQMDMKLVKYYDPFFTNGKIIKVTAGGFEFDALISKGNSGGPIINSKGNVLGVITQKEQAGKKIPGYGVAINAQSIKLLAPELFK
jgi:Trypsin-like peptidase domain